MRNHSLDTLKCLMAFLVVIIHCHCVYTETLSPITRCAVPVFFAISGFCINGDRLKEKLKRSLKRVLIVFIWSTILYGLFFIYKHIVHKDFSNFKIDIIIDFIIYNKHPFIYHLWYINAYIYVLIIMSVAIRWKKWKIIYLLIPCLLAYNIILGTYSKLFLGEAFSLRFLIPFLCSGLPFFLLGMAIKEFNFKKINAHLVLLITLFCLIGLFLEKKILPSDYIGDMYVFSPFFVTSLLLFVLIIHSKDSIVSRIGQKDSLNIYIIHPIIIDILQSITLKQSYLVQTIWNIISPLIVFLFSCMISRIMTLIIFNNNKR